jgi:hypothetical protein
MIMSEEERNVLTMKMYKEIKQIIEEKFTEFGEHLKGTLLLYMSKEDCLESHKFSDKRSSDMVNKIWIIFGISITSLSISCIALGMRIADILMVIK